MECNEDLAEGEREFVFLGTGTSVGVPMIGCECSVCTSDDPRNSRTRASVLVRSRAGNLLVDTPPELRIQMIRERIPTAHAVLFTHTHADHVFGLDDIRAFTRRLAGPVPIHCEPEVEDFIRRTFSYAFDAVAAMAGGGVPSIEFHRIGRPSSRVLDHAVVPLPLLHGRTKVLGFRIDDVAYCTDVKRIPEETWPNLEGLDVLVLGALRFEPHPTHFNLEEALSVIERLRPNRVYLTHISCRLDPEAAERMLPPNVQLAYDGLRFGF